MSKPKPTLRRSVTDSSGSGTRPATRDLRKSGRVPLALDVIFKIEEGGRERLRRAHEPIWAVSQDISLGGMFIKTSTPAPFGASVNVTILVPARGRALMLEGLVRWESPEGMGVQFGLNGARETHELTELLADL